MLGAYRAALDAEPILVVPTFADVDHYRRELAGDGVVFGVRVVAFSGLMREIARRAGVGGRPLSRLARERVAGAAIARVRLEALARVGRHAGLRPGAAAPRRRSSRSSASSPGAGGPPCGSGASASRRARSTPRSSRGSTAPTATPCGRSTAAIASCTTRRRWTCCAWSPRAGARRPCSSTASTTSPRSSATRSRRWRSTRARRSPSRSPTSPGARPSPGAARPSRSSWRSAPSTSSCRRAPSTTRAPRCTLWSARCSRRPRAGGPTPAMRCCCSRAAASAPSSSWSPPTSRG